jgi:enolase
MSTTKGAVKVPVSEYVTKHNLQKLIEDAVNQCYQKQAANPAAFFATFFAQKINSQAITKVVAREILDSRGNPTVEVDVYCGSVLIARASAPSGASTGSNEAKEIRDGDKARYQGKGVLKAVSNVNGTLNDVLKGKNVDNLRDCDTAMITKDGTELKENLGGNAITACSFAIAAAGAKLAQEELFLYLARQFHGNNEDETRKYRLPTPLVNILNGGKHAGGKLKIQEFMIVPRSDIPFKEALRYVTEVYHTLGNILAKAKGKSSKNVGDEGGFAPLLETPDEALTFIEQAIKESGYEVGKDVRLALDCAASEFYNSETKKYEVIEGKFLSSDEMVDFYDKLVADHPALISIEDPLDEADYDGWAKFTERLGSKIMVVGDDLFTTNPRLIKKGIEAKWANALLLKVNQIGTITEAMEAAKLMFDNKNQVIVSHRSGETETTLIADLSVAIGARFIKTGATARGERVAKYNRLLQIEEYLAEHNLLDTTKEETA